MDSRARWGNDWRRCLFRDVVDFARARIKVYGERGIEKVEEVNLRVRPPDGDDEKNSEVFILR